MTQAHSVFYNIFEIFCMGEHFALSNAVRGRLEKSLSRCLYPSPAKDDVVVPVLKGDKHKSKVEAWTRSYFSWAMQERLSDDQALLVALEHLEGKAHAWGCTFNTGATLEDFLYALCKEFQAFSGGLDRDESYSPRADKVVPQIKNAFAHTISAMNSSNTTYLPPGRSPPCFWEGKFESRKGSLPPSVL